MNNVKIAAIQNDIIWENINENILNFSKLISKVENVDIIVLPEMFTTGFTNNLSAFNKSITQKSIDTFSQICIEKKIAICASLIFNEEGKYYNRFIFIDSDGKIKKYDKRHLFAVGGENKIFTKGDTQEIINYKEIKIFPEICYDLRFPVWSRNTFNYDLIINVANWPLSRRNHWDCLLKARAIENQSYVVAVNRVGIDGNGITYNGGTKIIDYNGEIISEAKDNEIEIIYGELNFEKQNVFRIFMPISNDSDNFVLIKN